VYNVKHNKLSCEISSSDFLHHHLWFSAEPLSQPLPANRSAIPCDSHKCHHRCQSWWHLRNYIIKEVGRTAMGISRPQLLSLPFNRIPQAVAPMAMSYIPRQASGWERVFNVIWESVIFVSTRSNSTWLYLGIIRVDKLNRAQGSGSQVFFRAFIPNPIFKILLGQLEDMMCYTCWNVIQTSRSAQVLRAKTRTWGKGFMTWASKEFNMSFEISCNFSFTLFPT